MQHAGMTRSASLQLAMKLDEHVKHERKSQTDEDEEDPHIF
jgi:hypothetical protein